MVNQSKKYEDSSDIKSCEEVADFVCDTIYNFLSGYTAKGEEERYQKEFCDFFRNGGHDFSNGNFDDFYCKLDYLYNTIKNKQFATSMDSIERFKLLRLTHLYGNDALKIEEGVIQHIEVKFNRHSSYVMYEPLTSFDDFEGSVRNFCQSNSNPSGTYIAPIFQNNKFYLGLVNIENGQFDKNKMKIYAPQNEIFQGNEQACIDAIENIIFNSTDIESSDYFRNFSDFQKENTQRDFSDDDGPVIELVTTSSDEPQDMPPPQFDNMSPILNIPQYNPGPQNMPLYHQGSQNMSSYDSGAGFREVSLENEYGMVKRLLEQQVDFYYKSGDYRLSQELHNIVQSKKDIECREVWNFYYRYRKNVLNADDIKILQTLYGLEQRADFSVDSDGNTYMMKKNDSGEDICVCTTPVSYDDERFRQILQNFLKTHQNFSGIFVVTCNSKDTNNVHGINNWFLTTYQIENGQISNTHTNPIQYNNADFTLGMGATYCVNQLLTNQSYKNYTNDYRNNYTYLQKVQQLINKVNQSIEEQRIMQHTPEFDQSQFNMPQPLLPQFSNLPPIQNMPLYYQGSQNSYRGNPNFDLHGMPNNMPQFYVCDGFDREGYNLNSNNGNIRDTEYYFQSCRRNSHTTNTQFLRGANNLLKGESIRWHGIPEIGKLNPAAEKQAFIDSWSNFINDEDKSFGDKLGHLENGHMLNLLDIRLLQLFYAEEVKKHPQDQVIYHYNSLANNSQEEYLMQYNSLITEIKKGSENLSYFMMPVMWGGFGKDNDNLKNIKEIVNFLPSHLVQDGVYLIPTNGGEHWELTCVKKQGDKLSYFVTEIGSRNNNCGVNTTRAMQYVIEHGYEGAKRYYNTRFDEEVLYFDERISVEDIKYVVCQEKPLDPYYNFNSNQFRDNGHMSFNDTYASQRPIFRGTTEHSYFDTFNNFLANNTWENDYFSFENAGLNKIFKEYKGKEVNFGADFIDKFNEVCNSDDGKIELQYNYQGEQIKETINLKQIGFDRLRDYDDLNEEEKKLTQFLFHCKVAEMMKIAQGRYGDERMPNISLNDIFNSREKCNIRIGQKEIGFDIRKSKEDFSATATDISCTNVGKIQETLSRNYFQDKDNLTISVDRSQGITSASSIEDIRKMYFDIAFNGKSFTCTVLGKQREFNELLSDEILVDNLVNSFESAHIVTSFDVLSTDIKEEHGEITYKVGDKESDKEEFLSTLYRQEPCTMSYYVNGQERVIQCDTRTERQKAIKTMQVDAKVDGLKTYKRQIRSSTILKQVKTDNGGKFGGDGDFSCEIVVANDEYKNKILSTILPNCLNEDGNVNFKFKVYGQEYELEPKKWSDIQKAEDLSKIYEQQIASYYIASSIFNSNVDKIKIAGREIGIDRTNGSDNYQTVQQRLHTALQNKQDIELFIGEKQSTISTQKNAIRNTDNALREVTLGAEEVQRKVDAFKNALLTRYDDDLQCFVLLDDRNQPCQKYYFINENGVNCTKDIHDKGRNLKAQDLRNCKIREKQFYEKENTLYDIDFYDNVLSGQIVTIKQDIIRTNCRHSLLSTLNKYFPRDREDSTGSKHTYKFLKDGIEQTKHDDDTETQLIYKHKSGEEIIYTLPSFNTQFDIFYHNRPFSNIIKNTKLAIQDVQVFNDMDIYQRAGYHRVYIEVNGEQKDDCYIEGLETDQELDTLQKKFDFFVSGDRLLNYQPIKLHYKGGDYICSHKFQDNGDQYITRDNFKQNFNNFATILDMQEQGFIQVQYSNGDPCDNQDLYKAICYKKDVGREEIKKVQIVYGDKKIDLEPDEDYDIISGQLRDLKEQQEKDVEEVKKALQDAGLELKTTARNRKLYIKDKTSGQTYFFGIEGGGYLAINEKENTYAKLLNTRENVSIVKKINRNQVVPITQNMVINSVSNFKECLNAIVQNELNNTLDKYIYNVQKVDRTFGFEDVSDAIDPIERKIKLCGNQTIKCKSTDVKSIRDAQKKVECAPHPLLAQGISGGDFLEDSLIVDDTGHVKIKLKNCTEEYQLLCRVPGHEDVAIQVNRALEGQSTEKILNAICQKYSDQSNMQIYAKNGDEITTSAIPLYASAAAARDKDRFFDSFYQSFEKLELYNRLKQIRGDGDESQMEIEHDIYGHMTSINTVDQLKNIFKNQNIVSVRCQYGESDKRFDYRLHTSNPLNDCIFDDVNWYIDNTIKSKPSKDAVDVLSRIEYDTLSGDTKIKGREIDFFKVDDRAKVTLIDLVEDGEKLGFIDYKKLHKKVKSFKNTDKLRASYKTSDGTIIYNYISFEDDSLKNFVNKATFFDDFVKFNREEGIKYEIKNTYDNTIIPFSDNVVRMYNRLKGKKCKIKMTKDGDSEEIEVSFDTKDHIVEAITKLRDTADDLLNPIGLDMLNTFDSSKKKKHKKRKKTKDDSVDIEDTTVIKDEEIEESKKEKKKKEEKYDPFKDMENNPELRKLVESFIEKSNPDMSAVIRQDGMMKLIQSDSIIEDFRKSAKYDKDYLTNSSNAMDTMEDIQKLDDILHKEGDFYDKCDYYQTLGIKLANKNVHELQLLAVAEYVNRNENQEAKYFTSDKLNGPNYVYLEDKKLLISLSPEGYKDDFVGENKELEELIKNNSVTKLSAKKKDGDWVLDCYLNKDKEHLIVDSRTDNRQQDGTSSGVWAARSTSEIIELGVENFKFLNAYRQIVQKYPDFLRNEEPSDLNRIKLSFRKFNHLEKEEQTAETFAKILDEVENKSPVEVIQELKYTVIDKKNTGKSKQDKEKEEKEEAERKAIHNLEIDKKIEQITNKEKRNTFFGFSFSGSAMLAMGIGGPLGIVTGLTVCAALIFTRQMILRRKNKMKATQDVKEKYVENKPLLEAQPSLGNEVYNDSEKSKKDTTKLLAEDLSKLSTKDLDLNTSSIPVDNIKVKKKAQVR